MDSKGEIQIMSDEEAHYLAIQLTSASLLSTVIKTAIELGVFGIIATKADARAFLSPSEIASHLPNNKNHDAPAMLDRMLRLLACYSILTHSLRELPDGKVERLYGLGPVGKFLINNKDGVSMAPLCLFTEDKVSRESGNHLKDAILEGVVPFEKAHGMTLFKYEGIDPRFNNVFNSGMSNYSTIIIKKMLDTYKGFEGLNSLVDVAGGTGASLSMIVSKYPLIKGINFDLPHVIANAPSYPGVEHVGGDMFASLPKGDAIFMKSICHDWSDEYCLKLLKNCYDAIPENGKVIVAERIIPVAVDCSLATKAAVHVDILMLTNHPGGKERTEKEFQALATAAGFRGFRVMCRAFNTYVMEFLKKEI